MAERRLVPVVEYRARETTGFGYEPGPVYRSDREYPHEGKRLSGRDRAQLSVDERNAQRGHPARWRLEARVVTRHGDPDRAEALAAAVAAWPG